MSRPKRPVDRSPVSGSSSRETQTSRPSAGHTARPSGTRSAFSTRSSEMTSRNTSGSSRPSTARAGSSSRPISSNVRSNQRPSSQDHAKRPTAVPSRASATRSGNRGQYTFTQASSNRGISERSGNSANTSRSTATRRPTTGTGSAKRTNVSSSAKHPTKKRPKSVRHKMRPRWGRWFLLVLALLVCIKVVPDVIQHFSGNEEATTQVQSVSRPLVTDADKPGFDETINSDSAIIINVGNGDILYEKAADTQRAPASLVKMMTVYVAIKHCDDVNRELQMPKDAYKGLEENRASQSGLKAGETVTVRDLLYAAMLSSGGDAANALALITSGNINSFVELMNDEAKKMGLDSTFFKNPTGLDASGQVSTCRDMARLVKGALGNTLFKEVFTARTYTTTANDTHPEGLNLSHTMTKDLNTFQRYFDTSGYEIVGGKTGYTEKAGNCLVTLADKKKAPDFVVVTMHATGTGDQYYQAFHDAVTLYGAAYEQIKEAPAEQDGNFD